MNTRFLLASSFGLVGAFAWAGASDGLLMNAQARAFAFEGVLNAMGLRKEYEIVLEERPANSAEAAIDVVASAENAGASNASDLNQRMRNHSGSKKPYRHVQGLNFALQATGENTPEGESLLSLSPDGANSVSEAEVVAPITIPAPALVAEASLPDEGVRKPDDPANMLAAIAPRVETAYPPDAPAPPQPPALSAVVPHPPASPPAVPIAADRLSLERSAVAGHLSAARIQLSASLQSLRQVERGDFTRIVLTVEGEQVRCGTPGLVPDCQGPLSAQDKARVVQDMRKDFSQARMDFERIARQPAD